MVKPQIVKSNGEPISINYLIVNNGGRWQIGEDERVLPGEPPDMPLLPRCAPGSVSCAAEGALPPSGPANSPRVHPANPPDKNTNIAAASWAIPASPTPRSAT
jgi:hypothetical protein